MGSSWGPDTTYAQQAFPGSGGVFPGVIDCTATWYNSFTFNFVSGTGLPTYYGYGLFGGSTPLSTTVCFFAEAFGSPFTVPPGGGSITVTPTLQYSTCPVPYQPGFWAEEGLAQDLALIGNLPNTLTPTPIPGNFGMLFTNSIPTTGCNYTLADLGPDYVNPQATYTINGSAWSITAQSVPPCAYLFQQFFTYTFPSSLAGKTYYGVVITPKMTPSGNYAIFYYSFGDAPYVVPVGGGSLTLNMQILFVPAA